MKISILVAAALIGFMCVLVVGIAAEAAELKVLSASGMQAVMEDLGPKFERVTGHRLATTFAPLGGVVSRVQGGETGDVIVIPQQGIESSAQDGKIVVGTETILARAGLGVAVRRGAPKPDISSPEALKRTLLAAKSISYIPGGVSGLHFVKVLDRLGIANEMPSKTLFPKIPGEVGLMVTDGEAEMGVAQIQGLITVAGIELVGPLPGDLQDTIVFMAAIMASAKQTEGGKALIDFLRTPGAVAVIKAKGMEPATP